ncbi:MAG: proteasome assembly chaperone family protein [Candidatus Thermoplasmatota archaeon]
MDDVVFRYLARPELEQPVLIEGLPGVGNVGKLAVEHLIDQLNAEKFSEIFSIHFPPQVLILEGGTIRLVRNELFYTRTAQGDIILLTGDYQGSSAEGQYILSHALLKELSIYKLKRIYTLGGWSTGQIVEIPRVLGAATNPKLVKEMIAHGVAFSQGEPGGGIVGAAGLLLGLGDIQGIEGACLMGETSGYFVDPKSARAVLEVLARLLRMKISLAELEEKARHIEMLTSRLKEMENVEPPSKEDLDYFG